MTPEFQKKVARTAADILESNADEKMLGIEPFHGYVWRKGRAFFRAETREGSYFVKAGATLSGDKDFLVELLTDLPLPCFQIPPLIGRHDRVEVWGFRAGDSKSLASYTKRELHRLIEAVATTDATVKPPPDIPKTYWMKPIATALLKRVRTERELARFLPQARRFAAWERHILKSISPTHIIHNDLHSSNVIMTRDRVYLIDWDSVSLGPPGASLRIMSDWNRENRNWVAKTYSAYAAKAGLEVEPDAVLYAMQTHQIYWALRTAVRLNLIKRLPRALADFRKLIKQFNNIKGASK